MRFRLELEEWEVRNLIGILDVVFVADTTGADVEGIAALKAKLLAATAIVEVEEEKIEAARNGDAAS